MTPLIVSTLLPTIPICCTAHVRHMHTAPRSLTIVVYHIPYYSSHWLPWLLMFAFSISNLSPSLIHAIQPSATMTLFLVFLFIYHKTPPPPIPRLYSPSLFHLVFRFCCTFADQASVVTNVRVQVDQILALPSLLGVPHYLNTPSLSTDSDNATLTSGDGEVGDAVNDLLPGHPLAFPPQIPQTNSVSSIQIRNRMPGRQHTRHSVRPSDPPPSAINYPDLDRDHYEHHQATSLTIQSRANSTDGELSSPDSNPDEDAIGGNFQVSYLVTGLYTRCSLFDSADNHVYVSVYGI